MEDVFHYGADFLTAGFLGPWKTNTYFASISYFSYSLGAPSKLKSDLLDVLLYISVADTTPIFHSFWFLDKVPLYCPACPGTQRFFLPLPAEERIKCVCYQAKVFVVFLFPFFLSVCFNSGCLHNHCCPVSYYTDPVISNFLRSSCFCFIVLERKYGIPHTAWSLLYV